MRKRALIMYIACLPVACVSADSPGSDDFAVRDSAGITIVENYAPAWPDDLAWRVEPRPMLRIGELDGPPELSFGNVRAVGRLADGRIFVGDEQAHSIRVFSPQGEFLASAGREGQGPGELQWFLTVSPYRQDSLFVYDYAQRTVSVFGPDLAFTRRFGNPILEGNYWISGALPDGRFLAYSPGASRLEGGPGLVADTSLIIVVALDGTSADTVGAFRVGTRLVDANGRPQAQFLAQTPTVAVADSSIIWTRDNAFEYVELDWHGRVSRVVRKVHEPVAVTPELIADFREYYVDFLARESGEANEAMLARVREGLEEFAYPATLPPMSFALRVDPFGNRWIGHYEFVGTPADTWEVFDRSGVWLGTVRTPEGVEIHQVGVDAVIGVAKDEYGVAYAQVHVLTRGDEADN